MTQQAINDERLNRSLEELGRIGHTPQGMQRVAFSPLDIAGREHTVSLMRLAGLEVRTDPAGNIIGRREGSERGLPAIGIGSHVDTVPNGGKYDGALGTLAAIECAQTLQDHGIVTRHPVEVLVFTNEEGTGFHTWLFGSQAMAGTLSPEELLVVDQDGVSLGERLLDIGGNLDQIPQAARKPADLAAYFELHIEQGPTLHQSGVPIGVVTGITGKAGFEVRVIGAANHAGTTPMSMRQDALVSASRLVLAVERVAAELEVCRVSTVGQITAIPNATNVIPGAVEFSAEFRDVERQAMVSAEAEFRQAAREIEAADGVTVEINALVPTTPAPIATNMQDLVARAAGNAGLEVLRIPSGAGHDAQSMAALTGVAMIFVPSVNGISHSPLEFSTPEACANGAQVLMELLLMADQQV